MKFKKTAEGRFAKLGEDFKDNDILLITGDSIEQEGEFGTQVLFPVKTIKGDEKNLSFNATSRNRLIDIYGDESEKWVGKEVQVHVVKQNVGGKMKDVVYLCAPGQEMFPEV